VTPAELAMARPIMLKQLGGMNEKKCLRCLTMNIVLNVAIHIRDVKLIQNYIDVANVGMMTRHHTIDITARMWPDLQLRERIRRSARQYAGANPGVIVTVRREVSVQHQKTHYRSATRGRGVCANCRNVFKRHKANHVENRWECPSRSYWEVVAKYVNWSKEVQRWE